jgi:hypothetical protein
VRMIHGLSRLRAAPFEGSVIMASRVADDCAMQHDSLRERKRILVARQAIHVFRRDSRKKRRPGKALGG